MIGPALVNVPLGAPMLRVGAELSTVNVVLGPAAAALIPSFPVAVAAARLMPSVPSPVIELIVTVRVVVPVPDTATLPVAVPVVFNVTLPAANVTASAPV